MPDPGQERKREGWPEKASRVEGELRKAIERISELEAIVAAREEPPGGIEQKLRDALADALLWLERIPPPEEEIRALGRGLWDETLENARVLLETYRDTERPDLRKCDCGHEAFRHGYSSSHGWTCSTGEGCGCRRSRKEVERAAREDTERPDGQSTALVAVKAEDEIGLVRVQLSLDAPSYLLPVSQARNLGELLIEAADKLTHRDADQEPDR